MTAFTIGLPRRLARTAAVVGAASLALALLAVVPGPAHAVPVPLPTDPIDDVDAGVLPGWATDVVRSLLPLPPADDEPAPEHQPAPHAPPAPAPPPPAPAPVEIASFTTPLEPGQSRNVNIHRAADYVDGAVIAAGAGFSLNDAIGPRTAERGFVENGFIAEGETRSVVGGGVSQVATTFMNAAWEAGIHLVEFRPHSIYFERYPMCREATIIWNELDVVVVNDTPHDITVSTSYTDSSVTFALLGAPWAHVESWIGQPTDVQGPGGGFTVDCGRTITYPDSRTETEHYSWRYDSGFPG